MYRQILVNRIDAPYQCLLWRDSPELPIEEYSLLTVTYGTRSAPYLALRVLRQLVEDEGGQYPRGASVLLHDTFVDDLLFGEHTEQAADEARKEVIALLARGGFRARKWASNSAKLLREISPIDHGLAWKAPSGESEGIKVLGILWNPMRDAFEYKVTFEALKTITKKAVLSVIARLFEPMGWISPVVILGKMQMQALWAEKYTWDEELPPKVNKVINEYFDSLHYIENISVPRWTQFAGKESAEIHGFSDASGRAYGAVLYLHIVAKSDRVAVSLLASKTKVAPLKQVSIPRLELQAAVLLARLTVATKRARTLSQVPARCWSDSSVVLAWLKQPSIPWKQYVANRVAEVQTLLPGCEWRHVPTESNPADLLSREKSVAELKKSEMWWTGPRWLKETEREWPAPLTESAAETEIELRKPHCAVHLSHPSFDGLEQLFNRVSSWPRMLHAFARVSQFIEIVKEKVISRVNADATNLVRHINAAEKFIVKYLQRQMFPEEREALERKVNIKLTSKLIALRPFLEDGLIRVGGRLENSQLEYTTKHPVVLARHLVTRRIVEDAHRRCLHGGVKHTISTVRAIYWLLNARAQAKFVVNRCVICAKIRARLSHQVMANLPALRVTRPRRVFENCGVDYAGPLQVRMAGGRGQRAQACYIVIFVCFAVKAVHLEVATSYSTDAFIAALQRFVSRRGTPIKIISDCGTNFRGAERELNLVAERISKEPVVQEFVSSRRIEWQFNPPAAPHFGGLWEAGVKSVKGHLKRIFGARTPTLEELSTLLCQIEATLNSRPLGPVTDTVDDLSVIMPGHFLTGDTLISIPQPSLVEIPKNRLSRWQDMQQCVEKFWQLWSGDYLQSLQQRTKWRLEQQNIQEGQIVLLRQPNLPPTKWLLGRIEKCHPNADGKVRTVQIKTAKSSFLRPITQIALLPIDLIDKATNSSGTPQTK